ncbi:MAG: GIY-YIG nuclease family protein [Bradyrhizobium sp.]
MAGLVVPADIAGGWIYILTDQPNGILYLGTTNTRSQRVFEHRSGFGDGFTKQQVTRLVIGTIFSISQRRK